MSDDSLHIGDDRPSEPDVSPETGFPDSRPAWDGGRAILYFILAAFTSLLITVGFSGPLGFNGSVIASEVIVFGLIPAALSVFFATGWRRWFARPMAPGVVWPWAIVAILAFVVTQSNLLVLLDRIYPIPDSQLDFFRQYLTAQSPSDLFGMICIAALVPAIFEEIAFRGLIHNGLRVSYGPRQAIVWTAFLFALLHMNPWNFVSLWTLGCFLGYMTERTRSIVLAVVLHLVNNTCAVVLLYVQGKEQWDRRPEFIPWYWTFLAGVAMILAVWKVHRLTEVPASLPPEEVGEATDTRTPG